MTLLATLEKNKCKLDGGNFFFIGNKIYIYKKIRKMSHLSIQEVY